MENTLKNKEKLENQLKGVKNSEKTQGFNGKTQVRKYSELNSTYSVPFFNQIVSTNFGNHV